MVAALFSILLITRTHVTEIPDKLRELGGREPRSVSSDGAEQSEQFPNEVRVGDDTLAFADGVPSHDGSDEDEAPRKESLSSRLFKRRKPQGDDDGKLDQYAGDEAFLKAASRHGEAAETNLGNGARSVSSGGAYNDDMTRSIDSGTWNAQPAPSGSTVPMPSGNMPRVSQRTDPWAHMDSDGETMVVSTADPARSSDQGAGCPSGGRPGD